MDETVAFYEDALGWYTVKRTQNYDDPGTPHYYFSSTPTGEPGTTVTYFEYPGSQGRPARGGEPSLRVRRRRRGDAPRVARPPPRAGVRVSEVKDRTYFKSIYFSDPDGLVFELATEGRGSPATRRSPAVRRSTRSRKGTRSKRFAERTRVVRRRYRYCRRRRYRYCRRRRYR